MAVTLRQARDVDLAAIVALLADDHLGSTRETTGDLAPYERALAALTADPNQFVLAAESNGQIVGTLQLTIVPGLARAGATRAIVEGVRVSAAERGEGIGVLMFDWVFDTARERGASLVQLTSDNSRVDAHRFYERMGFEPSHVGFKRAL